MATSPSIAHQRVDKRQRDAVAPLIRKMAIKYPELSNAEIARTVGCTPQNVSYTLSKYLADTSPEQLQHFQDNRADIFDAITMRSLLSITPQKLGNSQAIQLATIAGITHDKSQVLRGQATGINVNVLLDVAAAIRDKQASQVIDAQPVSKPGE